MAKGKKTKASAATTEAAQTAWPLPPFKDQFEFSSDLEWYMDPTLPRVGETNTDLPPLGDYDLLSFVVTLGPHHAKYLTRTALRLGVDKTEVISMLLGEGLTWEHRHGPDGRSRFPATPATPKRANGKAAPTA